jgi:hypothetical protein
MVAPRALPAAVVGGPVAVATATVQAQSQTDPETDDPLDGRK